MSRDASGFVGIAQSCQSGVSESVEFQGMRKVDRVLVLAILAGGLLSIIAGAYLILSSQTPVPWWDEWEEVDAVIHIHPLPLSWLWAQHNEHRILFYRLLFLADIRWFHGRHWVEFAAMLATQVLSLALLAGLLRVIGKLRGDLWRAGFGLAAFCLFCPSQRENFDWGFQISFLLPGFFLLLALFGLLRSQLTLRAGRRWGYLFLAILAAAAATYANGNGIIAWPALVVTALLLRARPYVVALLALAGGILLAFYLHGYVSPPQHSSPLHSLVHPWTWTMYTARYFGAKAFHGALGTGAGVVTGSILLLAGLVLAARSAARRQLRQPLPAALLALMIFSVGTAFVTALGRMGFGLDQATASRYQTFVLLYYFAFVVLVLLSLAATKAPALRTACLAAITLVMLLHVCQYPRRIGVSHARTLEVQTAALAMVTGVPDPKALILLYPAPEVPWRDLAYIRAQRWFMFSGDRYPRLDQALTSSYRPGSADRCAGQVEELQRVVGSGSGGLRISGWGLSRRSGRPLTELVAAVDGQIEGFALGGFLRRDLQLALHSARARNSGWVGYVRMPALPHRLDVYGVVDANHHEVCPVGSASLRAPGSDRN